MVYLRFLRFRLHGTAWELLSLLRMGQYVSEGAAGSDHVQGTSSHPNPIVSHGYYNLLLAQQIGHPALRNVSYGNQQGKAQTRCSKGLWVWRKERSEGKNSPVSSRGKWVFVFKRAIHRAAHSYAHGGEVISAVLSPSSVPLRKGTGEL